MRNKDDKGFMIYDLGFKTPAHSVRLINLKSYFVNLFLIVALVGFFAIVPVALADVGDGLIGYWPFDDGSGTTTLDASQNGYDGTLQGNPIWNGGKIGNALDFDGEGDYVSVSDIPLPSSFTITAWIKPGTGGDMALDRAIFGKHPSEYQLLLVAPNYYLQTLRGRLQGTSGDRQIANEADNFYSADYDPVLGSPNINTWQHVAYVVDTVGGTHALYRNGVLGIREALIGTPADTGNDIWIGGNSYENDTYFVGAIDEVRFYDRVLTDADIQAVYELTEATAVTLPEVEVVPAPSDAGGSDPGPAAPEPTTSPSSPVPPEETTLDTPTPLPPPGAFPTPTPTPSNAFQFSRNLTIGSQNGDVRILQKFLNTNGFIVAQSGPGSPGNETDYFGNLTKMALIRFQEAYKVDILEPLGLPAGTGFFGQSSIKKANELITSDIRDLSSGVLSPDQEDSATVAVLQEQINALLEQVRLLQEQLQNRVNQ